MADFVRGNPQGDYPAEIIDGIFMHRRIDVMTDNRRKSKRRGVVSPADPPRRPHHPRRHVGSFPSQHWTQLSLTCRWTSSYATPSGRSSPSCPTRRPASSISINICGRSAGWSAIGNGFYSARAERHGQPPSTSRGATRLGRIWISITTVWRRSSGALSADDAPAENKQL